MFVGDRAASRQPTLFGVQEPVIDDGFHGLRREQLDDRTWVDHLPGWLVGADEVFDALVERLPFRQRRAVPMYDSLVDEPRLSAWWRASRDVVEPLPVLADARRALTERYGVAFDSIGFNLYRDGADSVAWHGDRHRHHVDDPIVAILSVGERRPLRLRPRAGGGAARRSLAWPLGHGDLFVMGGACQHEWEHTVPKVRLAGPRISITFRHGAETPKRLRSWAASS